MTVDANMLFLQTQVMSFESKARQSLSTINRCDSIMSLARAANFYPRPTALIRNFPEVRQSSTALRTAIEARAAALVEDMKKSLESLSAQGDSEEILKKTGEFHRDLQYLSGHAPLAVQNGTRAIQVARNSAKTEPKGGSVSAPSM